MGSFTLLRKSPLLHILALALLLVTWTVGSRAIAPARASAPPALGTHAGLHVRGSQIVNAAGQPVRLLGVNRAGTEYVCLAGGIFDGPADAASVQAMRAWGINTVRLPLSAHCWLGLNGVPPAFAGVAYRQAIRSYVELLTAQGLATILELHWSGPGAELATTQRPMPDREHAVEFWRQVATEFGGFDSVLLDLHNEPSPDDHQDTPAAWQCWRDGGNCPGVPFPAAGMQELVSVVRSAGARNVILLSGVRSANALSRWLDYRPADPENNLAAAWHAYPNARCNNVACYESTVASLARHVPVVATEIGQNDGHADFIEEVMAFLDSQGLGYLAWAWNAWGPAPQFSLIIDYAGTPSPGYGAAFRDHLAKLGR